MMSLDVVPSHVAVVVPSVRKAADFLRRFDFDIGDEEIWEGEGTKEIYVERDEANSLLLMEPIRAGAYQRALEKRGPGLHHMAIDVLNLETYIESLSGSGWLLHPMSIKTIGRSQTAYLARPGFPSLIEVQQKPKLHAGPLFVEAISLPFEANLRGLVNSIGLSQIVTRTNENAELAIRGKRIKVADLF